MAESEIRGVLPMTGAQSTHDGGDGSCEDGGDGGGGGSAGWGRWGLSSFSVLSNLQKVASTAAQEISRNVAVVAKSIRDLEIVDEEPKSDVSIDKEGKEAESEVQDESDILRKSALDRLERGSAESLLGQGLKVFDSSVESLASGAWLALGNALKGGSDLVHKLEHSASHLASSIQSREFPGKATSLAPSILETGKSFTARGMQVLEKVGKETMELIISEAGFEVEKNPKKVYQHVDEEAFEDVTFERCFYIYGGPDHLEELEALSSHYALLYNRRRTKLQYEQKAFYDEKLKQILQIFNLSSDLEESGLDLDKGKNIVTANDGIKHEMETLRDSSIRKAADMAAGFTTGLGGIPVKDMVQRTVHRLDTVHSETVHRLSELCCFALSHLMTLGQSVISYANKSKPEEAEDILKIDWPEEPVLKAKVIKFKAQQMSADVVSVSNSFLTGIADVMEAYTAASAASIQQAEDGTVQERVSTISSLIETDQSIALDKIQEALKYLTYVVLHTSMPSA